jgi:Astacin (Peptidase family M12A)
MRRLFVLALSVVVVLGVLAACSQAPFPVRTSSAPLETHLGEWQHSSGDLHTAHFSDESVTYEIIDGLALYQGDIVLGTAAEVEALASEGLSAQSIGIKNSLTNHAYRWENRIVPYRFSTALSATTKAFIEEAIQHWEEKTPIHFVPRTTQVDYIYFIPSTGCSSYVGKQGGAQNVWIAEACEFGSTVHEIAHAVGYWHEQSRCDRDTYVEIFYDKIQAGYEHNFNKHCTDGTRIGRYDLDSIMHYPKWAFALDSWGCYTGDLSKCTILPKNGVDPDRIGQRAGLSTGDLNGVTVRYRATFPCTVTACQYRSGVLSTGSSKIFTAANNSTLNAWLEGSQGTNFDLYLQKNTGGTWVNVASSVNATSTEQINATGLSAGSYRWRIRSLTGGSNGSFDFWTNP